MFSGFNLKIKKEFFKSSNEYYRYIKIAKNILNCDINAYKRSLKDYVIIENIDGECLNGTTIQNNWFPLVEADVFISHSHADKKLANAFAGWLYDEFGLTSFIDSNIWGYVDELLMLINNKYSNRRITPYGGCLYNHEKCNKASQHTNIMLLMALQNMIDKVESVFLLNTDQSINVFEERKMNSTYSPWIYSEIVCTQLIRKKKLSEYRKPEAFLENYIIHGSDNQLKVNYDVSLEHLKSIDESNLNNWKNNFTQKYKRKVIPLDALYETVLEGTYIK